MTGQGPWGPEQYDPRQHRQHLGQPPWQPYEPQGQPRAQPGYQAPQRPPGWQQPEYGQQPPRPPRKPWVVRHKVLTGLIAFTSLIVIGGVANAVVSGSSANLAANTPTGTGAASPAVTVRPSAAGTSKPSAKPKSTAQAEAACDRRGFASGDIYVRMLSPGIQWTAQQLGGEWVWNNTLGKCLTSVQMVIATAPMVPGSCTQVGYVADNPGYDPNANVAAPLKQIAEQAGPAC